MHSNAATLRKASIWSEASRVVGEEGFRAFWKGNLVTIAHRLPYSSLNFYAYERYKKVSTKILDFDIFYNKMPSLFWRTLLLFGYYLILFLPSSPFQFGHFYFYICIFILCFSYYICFQHLKVMVEI